MNAEEPREQNGEGVFAGEFPLQAASLVVLLLGQCQTLLSS